MQPKMNQLQSQKLILAQGMRQFMQILQMNGEELKEWLEEELRQNPLLEWEMKQGPCALSIDIPNKTSLFEELLSQAREAFTADLLPIAEGIIRNLDKKGLFTLDLSDFAESLQIPVSLLETVLKKIQSFEPKGIGARNLAECLMLQLDEKKDPLLYQILQTHFSELIEGKWGFLKKHYKLTDEIFHQKVLQRLKNLSFSPAGTIHEASTFYPYPDLKIKKGEKGWVIEISEDLPQFHVQENVDRLLQSAKLEEKKELRTLLAKGKWLMRILNRRRRLLLKLGLFIVQRQKEFLDGKAGLSSLSIKEIAKEFDLHPSTITRAFKEKYVETPLGIKPLHFFLSSNNQKVALTILKNLLEKEDKARPFTDQELVKKLQESGIKVARRTVAKYRKKIFAPSKNRRLTTCKNRIDHTLA